MVTEKLIGELCIVGSFFIYPTTLASATPIAVDFKGLNVIKSEFLA